MKGWDLLHSLCNRSVGEEIITRSWIYTVLGSDMISIYVDVSILGFLSKYTSK